MAGLIDEPAPHWLEAMSVLALQPGDAVVFKTNDRLTSEQAGSITTIMKAHPAIAGHEVLILSHGLEIGVLRREAT